MTGFQKIATAALVSVLLLIFVGAVVRVTGSGMGCPDWPTCWGCLIPPTSVDQVDFERLPIERFQKKAERMGRDPATITEATLRAEFNPRHVWTEFINRLCSLPVGLFTLATFIAAFAQRQRRPLVFWLAFGALVVVLVNAWMGARVVYSGLKPGVLTTHLALAMGLLGMQAYCAWRGTDRPWRIAINPMARTQARWLVGLLLVLVVAEGILGSQVREITDELAKVHRDVPRSAWIAELEDTWIYLAHRSFSWVILALTVAAWWHGRRHGEGGRGPGWAGQGVHAVVWVQMLLGLVMSQIHIYSWVQVLHVGLAAVLLTLLWLWIFALSPAAETSRAG